MMGNLTTTFSVDEVFKIQNERIRTQDYTQLGRLVWIGLELQLDHAPSKTEQLTRGRVDFMHDGPLLAMSKDCADLLLPDGVPLELPDVPDPEWKPKIFTQQEIETPGWTPDRAPMIKQSWIERATGKFVDAGNNWVVFQPVIQIVYRLFNAATYGLVRCKPMPWTGNRTALLVQPETGKAYFYGGTYEIGVR